MITHAQQYAQQLTLVSRPRCQGMDVRLLASYFPQNSFDGAWVSASLIHIPEPDVPAVLRGLHQILTPEGKAFFALKAWPQGTRLVREFKYGREIEREFTFWEEAEFTQVLGAAGFRVTACERGSGGTTGGTTTQWLNVFADVMK